MRETSLTSGPKKSKASRNAISSPASASGALHYDPRIGPIIAQYGLEAVLANLSARQAREVGLLTSGTYGPRSTILLESAHLQSSLANKLRAKTASLGSTLYRLTWKERVTPSGRWIPALRASVLRTSGNDSTSERKGWNTPRSTDGSNGGPNQANGALYPDAVMCGWPTPMAGTPAQKGYNEAGNTDAGRKTAYLCGAEIADANINPIPNWNGPARLTASGEMRTGCSAGMASGGQLSPRHSLWLMLGPIAIAWLNCAERVMRSTSRKREDLSKRSGKALSPEALKLLA